jgi:hypothetical protein
MPETSHLLRHLGAFLSIGGHFCFIVQPQGKREARGILRAPSLDESAKSFPVLSNRKLLRTLTPKDDSQDAAASIPAQLYIYNMTRN